MKEENWEQRIQIMFDWTKLKQYHTKMSEYILIRTNERNWVPNESEFKISAWVNDI